MTGDQELDLAPLATVKYMGNKRALLAPVVTTIASLVEPGRPLVDLFAGTHAIGYALRDRNPIVGADTQAYSAVIGRAVLRDRLTVGFPAVLERLAPHVQYNRDACANLYGTRLLTRETQLLGAVSSGDLDAAEKYAAFQLGLPDPARWSVPLPARQGLDRRLRAAIHERRSKPTRFPYLLLSAYYANAYFGLQQAIWLDSLRYAIDQAFPERSSGRDVCMLALLSAASNTTSSPGHFAMWRQIRTAQSACDIVAFRRRDPLVYFQAKLQELAQRLGPPRFDHRVLVADAQDMVAQLPSGQDAGVAYVDPPYSAVHYSRFYHVLEELVEYDYPPVFFTGRFPSDRYVSPYSVRSSAGRVFGELLNELARRGWATVISYGRRGLVSEPALVRLCQRAFGNAGIRVEQVTTRHASMGRADRGARSVRELLITCKPASARRAHRPKRSAA